MNGLEEQYLSRVEGAKVNTVPEAYFHIIDGDGILIKERVPANRIDEEMAKAEKENPGVDLYIDPTTSAVEDRVLSSTDVSMPYSKQWRETEYPKGILGTAQMVGGGILAGAKDYGSAAGRMLAKLYEGEGGSVATTSKEYSEQGRPVLAMLTDPTLPAAIATGGLSLPAATLPRAAILAGEGAGYTQLASLVNQGEFAGPAETARGAGLGAGLGAAGGYARGARIPKGTPSDIVEQAYRMSADPVLKASEKSQAMKLIKKVKDPNGLPKGVVEMADMEIGTVVDDALSRLDAAAETNALSSKEVAASKKAFEDMLTDLYRGKNTLTPEQIFNAAKRIEKVDPAAARELIEVAGRRAKDASQSWAYVGGGYDELVSDYLLNQNRGLPASAQDVTAAYNTIRAANVAPVAGKAPLVATISDYYLAPGVPVVGEALGYQTRLKDFYKTGENK